VYNIFVFFNQSRNLYWYICLRLKPTETETGSYTVTKNHISTAKHQMQIDQVTHSTVPAAHEYVLQKCGIVYTFVYVFVRSVCCTLM